MSARIPESKLPRIVIIGAGFGGLKLARILANKPYQIVLVDKHNFHQFQPLFYQVATAGLAPSAIAFPIRKLFHQTPNVHFRMVSVLSVNTMMKSIETDIGTITFDKLVIATGADTNYFGNTSIQKHAFPMKSIEESLQLRNRILQCMEAALVTDDDSMRKALMNIVIVGGVLPELR
jgi:NADH:ubiquinone reductase (H+-translocating)